MEQIEKYTNNRCEKAFHEQVQKTRTSKIGHRKGFIASKIMNPSSQENKQIF